MSMINKKNLGFICVYFHEGLLMSK